MQVAAALSRTPEGPLAAAEAADAVAVDLPAGCDLAVVIVALDHRDDLPAIGLAVEARLEPGVLLAAVAQGVVGPGPDAGGPARQVTDGPAVAVWGAHLPAGHVQPFRTWAVPTQDRGIAVAGWPDTQPDDVVLLLSDGSSFPAAEVAVRVSGERGPTIVGGVVAGGSVTAAFLLDEQRHDDGAVGVVLRDIETHPAVAQGCRPIGEPLTVTAVERNEIRELGGRPAAERLQELLAALDEVDRDLLDRGGLQIGLVVDEVRDTYTVGDFLVRGVLAIDPDTGGVTVGDLPRIGQTVQFQVRDPAVADRHLADVLAAAPSAAGSLLFTCAGRGAALFGDADHDARTVEAHGLGPVAGAVCEAELGPQGGRSRLHGYTATVLAFLPDDAR